MKSARHSMPAPVPDPGDAGPISRRAFLGCCSALALAAAGCGRLSPRTRSAYVLATDPPLAQYEPILDGLVRAVLPCERPDFPVTAAQVRSRLLTLFALERDARFLDLQKALVMFDQTDLFAEPLVPPQAEVNALDADALGLDAETVMGRSHARDVAAYAAFARRADDVRFIALPVERQRAYLELWRESGYLIRRQFYASARSLVMIAAYSMEAVWPVIGYAGPLVDKGHA